MGIEGGGVLCPFEVERQGFLPPTFSPDTGFAFVSTAVEPPFDTNRREGALRA